MIYSVKHLGCNKNDTLLEHHSYDRWKNLKKSYFILVRGKALLPVPIDQSDPTKRHVSRWVCSGVSVLQRKTSTPGTNVVCIFLGFVQSLGHLFLLANITQRWCYLPSAGSCLGRHEKKKENRSSSHVLLSIIVFKYLRFMPLWRTIGNRKWENVHQWSPGGKIFISTWVEITALADLEIGVAVQRTPSVRLVFTSANFQLLLKSKL